jgi:hypothetical protein
LYCGKEIGPFRLLRDKEFCCSAHRQGYILGKALGRISEHQPPPAPIAAFIPYKPFAGNNRTLSHHCTLEPFRPAIQLLSSWPLSVVPLPRERAAQLPLLARSLAAVMEFSAEPQPWSADKSPSHPSTELGVHDPVSVFAAEAKPDPAPGAAIIEFPAADWPPESTVEPDRSWAAPAVRLPDASGTAMRTRSLAVCAAAPGLLAEAVEAFLPPNPEPEMVGFGTSPAVRLHWSLQPIDWEVVAEPAKPAPAAAAEAVESFLPPFAEPRIAAWPTVAAVPQLALTTAAAEWTVSTAMAEPVAGPVADPVESFLPRPAEPQISAWPAAAALPQLALTTAAADWMVSTAMAEPVAGPVADPVESFLPRPAEPQISAWPVAAALPQLALAAADWMVATVIADPVAGPVADPVESFLPRPAEPQIATWPAAAALPQLALAAVDWTVATVTADPVAGPVADPVESFLPCPAEPQIAAWPACAAVLPRFSLSPAAWVLSVDLAGPVAAPAAQAVESLLPANLEPQKAIWPAATRSLPRLALEPVDWELSAWLAEPAASLAAAAVESLLPAPAEPVALPMFAATVKLPELALAAIEPEPVEEFVPPLVVADACQEWMPSPPACDAAREVNPVFGGVLAHAASPAAAPLSLALAQPAIRWEGDWRPSATAEPVIAYVAPHFEPAMAASFSVSAPRIAALQKIAARRSQNLAAPAAESYPEAAEPSAAGLPIVANPSGARTPVLRFPGFSVEHATSNWAAAFRPAVPSAIEPAASKPNRGADAPLEGEAAVRPLDSSTPVLRCGFPLARPATSDFICQRTPMAPIKSLRSIGPNIAVQAPKFVVRPIFERVEEAVAPPPKPVEKTPAFAEIFAISKASRRTTAVRWGLFSAGKLIAASLIVGLGMWFGAGSVKISRQLLAINYTLRDIGSTNTSSGMATTSSGQGASYPSLKYSTAKSEGPIAKVRHAIQNRAALELTDTFRRMEAWGASAMALPVGWSRNADGYVRTGQLALYGPTQTFTDYHFEFFGEIEKKSMDWAIRARDSKNYYGMKMTVIEPGLRPVVAMVHYAVVDGKKGQRVETPLSIMMHNNEPYHVAVDVKGNHVVTSIEGQEVDSWTDDLLKVGGVGFFSEVGESARLYWMRVSKNQDWLGRVCAYVASGSGSDTADLWREEIPRAPWQPSTPAPPPARDVAMAAAEDIEEFSEVSPQRARISKYGRTELCRS